MDLIRKRNFSVEGHSNYLAGIDRTAAGIGMDMVI